MSIDIINILYTTIVISVPLIIGALGGMVMVRAGILALGLESMMLMGAFTAAVGAYYTGNAYIGLLCGMLGGAFIGLIHGILSVKYKVDQVISGIGLNLLVAAFTNLLLKVIWDNSSMSGPIGVQLPKIHLSIVENIPILNRLILDQSIVFYIMILLVILLHIMLFKTVFGLRLRMIGENPKAAATLGINVNKYKYISVVVGGLIIGMAGAYLSIDYLDQFTSEMSAGRGYISVVINILGGFKPIWILFAGLLFGVADAIQISLQGFGVPTQLIQMMPYIITLIVLVLWAKKSVGPLGVGKNYDD